MSSDVVRNSNVFRNSKFKLRLLDDAKPALSSTAKWLDMPVSQPSHHLAACCELAREWLIAMDCSQLNGSSKLVGPRWLNARYTWGPTIWPIHWCEMVEEKTLDCGAQSAMAHEVFKARGVNSYRIQLIQHFSHDTTRQWAERWSSKQASTFWIENNLIYHECCAIGLGETAVKLWDSSAGSWIGEDSIEGYGSVRALRLMDEKERSFRWGIHTFNANVWYEL